MPGPDVPVDPWRSVLRLMVGGSIEAVAALRHLLEEAEASQARPSADVRLASFEGARSGLSRVADASASFARFWWKASLPARKVLGSLTYGSEAARERWIQAGQAEVRRSRSLALSFANLAVDRAAEALSSSRAVDGLVRAIAGNYLRYLEANPERLEALVRSQGDRYVEYLNRNPDMVKELVAGQSSGLASELVEGVRARTVSADNVFEAIVRSVLRRTPREELPEPPPGVQRRAERGTLPADLKPPKVDDDPGR